MVSNRNEQSKPDDPCEKYGLESAFYQFESKIADANVRFKVIKFKFYFHLLFQMCISLMKNI